METFNTNKHKPLKIQFHTTFFTLNVKIFCCFGKQKFLVKCMLIWGKQIFKGLYTFSTNKIKEFLKTLKKNYKNLIFFLNNGFLFITF